MNEPEDYSPGDPDARASLPAPRRVPVELAGARLDQVLARLFPEHSRSRLQAWLKDGLIRLDGMERQAKHKVHGGEELVVAGLPPLPEQLAFEPEAIPLDVVYEDASILVIDKPAGLVVHPGSGNWSGTLLNALLHHAPALAGLPRAGIVHRLDKDTTGLMVVAKTLEAQTDLVRQLQQRTVARHYYALVYGDIASDGEIDADIDRHPVQRTRMAVVPGGRPALTRYAVRQRLHGLTLVECRLQTGRTHQIRVHMAHLGHPLVGDPVYGPRRVTDSRVDGFSRQALHAFRLGLLHPASGEDMVWSAPLPADFAALLEKVGGRADA
ncbi:pseudouridylate synthase [Azoarcus olearius]|uniref:Pseudouridine synthase n=1 Tax=Azoarcus sp. (strain BH72) TaxID=418699 RepID=A1K480_AZOSB|nr:pseudouridylate synthase [Azoarcus olearius]